MPVEAVAFVVIHCSLVALMLGEVSPFVQNLLSLEPIAGHLFNHFAHGVGQQLSDLIKSSTHIVRARNMDLVTVNAEDKKSASLRTLRCTLISISRPLAALISFEDISFLLRMARGTSGLGVRLGWGTGGSVIGGTGSLSDLGLP